MTSIFSLFKHSSCAAEGSCRGSTARTASLGAGGSRLRFIYSLNSDYRFDPIERKTFTADASEIAVSPNGKLSAVVIRGEIFIIEKRPTLKPYNKILLKRNSPNGIWLVNSQFLINIYKYFLYKYYRIKNILIKYV